MASPHPALSLVDALTGQLNTISLDAPLLLGPLSVLARRPRDPGVESRSPLHRAIVLELLGPWLGSLDVYALSCVDTTLFSLTVSLPRMWHSDPFLTAADGGFALRSAAARRKVLSPLISSFRAFHSRAADTFEPPATRVVLLQTEARLGRRLPEWLRTQAELFNGQRADVEAGDSVLGYRLLRLERMVFASDAPDAPLVIGELVAGSLAPQLPRLVINTTTEVVSIERRRWPTYPSLLAYWEMVLS